MIWGTSFSKERLQKIQKKAARLITRTGEDDSKTILVPGGCAATATGLKDIYAQELVAL